MRISFRRIRLASVAVGLGLFSVAPAMAGFITFDHREDLNLLNSPDVTITANHAFHSTNLLRGASLDTSPGDYLGWFSGYFSDTLKESWVIDLGSARNLETLRLNGYDNITAATLETSSDGSTWSSGLSHSTTVSGKASTFVLDAAVNSRWLRITGEAYHYQTDGQRRVFLDNMRLYGSTGTVVADPALDLVSSTGWTGGNATVTQIGSLTTSGVPSNPLTDMADDNHADLNSRQLVYRLQAGDSLTVTFDTTVDDIGRVGFTWGGGNDNANTHFQLLGSTDGVSFSSVLLDQTGGLVTGPNFFTLATPYTGKAVRLSIVSTDATADRNEVADMFVFQVPEPASLALLALGAATLLARRRIAGGRLP